MVKREKEIVRGNENNYLHNERHCPGKDKTSRGVHFWDSHPINLLLQQDMKDAKEGKNAEQLLSKLRMTRKEDKYLSVKTSCGLMHQEKRNQREDQHWISQQKKNSIQNHEEEANTVKNDLDNRSLKKSWIKLLTSSGPLP